MPACRGMIGKGYYSNSSDKPSPSNSPTKISPHYPSPLLHLTIAFASTSPYPSAISDLQHVEIPEKSGFLGVQRVFQERRNIHAGTYRREDHRTPSAGS